MGSGACDGCENKREGDDADGLLESMMNQLLLELCTPAEAHLRDESLGTSALAEENDFGAVRRLLEDVLCIATRVSNF